MGSFAGVNIDAQNLQQAVSLAEQKKLLAEQSRLQVLNNSLTDYRNSLFPDGQYYVTNDFNSSKVTFKGDFYNPNLEAGLPPVIRQFKKGELVNVVTYTKDMAMNTVKVIQTDSGMFYADQNNLSKTKPVDPVYSQSLTEVKKDNSDKTKIMIIGAFILGFLLSKD